MRMIYLREEEKGKNFQPELSSLRVKNFETYPAAPNPRKTKLNIRRLPILSAANPTMTVRIQAHV